MAGRGRSTAWGGGGGLATPGTCGREALRRREIVSLWSSEAARVLVIVFSWANCVHLEQKGKSWGKGVDCWRTGGGCTSSASQEL